MHELSDKASVSARARGVARKAPDAQAYLRIIRVNRRRGWLLPHASILLVVGDRVAKVLEMRTDLVRAAGNRKAAD